MNRISAKQRIEELSKSTGRLETELAAEQTKAINLSLEINAANEHNTQLQAHAQWLQNEWDAASAKVHELSHSSHHWWTVADQLSQEKQSIYSSKFWRISLAATQIYASHEMGDGFTRSHNAMDVTLSPAHSSERRIMCHVA